VGQLQLDLYGPGLSDVALHVEVLEQAPSRWYLTGFLVPRNAPEEQRAGDADAEGDLDSGDDAGGSDDQATPDKASGRRAWRPSSLGLSFLITSDTSTLDATLTWGDYTFAAISDDAGSKSRTNDDEDDNRGRWQRTHRIEKASLNVSKIGRFEVAVPRSSGLVLAVLVRPVSLKTESGTQNVKSVSVFVVNNRTAREEKSLADEAFMFQAHLAILSPGGICPRYAMHGIESDDWDESVADLHYRDVAEYAVGHNTAAEWNVGSDGICREVSSCCTPMTPVPRVVPNPDIANFELEMEALGKLHDPVDASTKLSGVVSEYRRWIAGQKKTFNLLHRSGKRSRPCSSVMRKRRPRESPTESRAFRNRACSNRLP
jgi:hypothetical protein